MGKKGINTEREIYSQPSIWEQTLTELSRLKFGKSLSDNTFDQILVTGCGSTYYLSIWAAHILQRKFGVMAHSLPASELWMSPESWIFPKKTYQLLAISRSGTTSETVAAVKHIKPYANINTGVITCFPDSELAKLADTLIAVPSAQEKSIAQTRSFTNMMLGISFFIERDIMDGLQERLASLGSLLIDQNKKAIKDIANDNNIERFFFLGSGSKYGLACEAMLKMKEMSLSYSEAYHFLEFRHGPMSMVNDQSLVVGLLGSENKYHELQVLKDMKNLGATILAIGDEILKEIPGWIDHYIPLTKNYFGPYGDVLYLPCLQILSYEKAISNSLDPDNPHNLTAVVVLDL